jgi:thermitase
MILALACATPVSAKTPLSNRSTTSSEKLNQILVRYKSDQVSSARASISAAGFRSKQRIPKLNVDVIPVPAGQSVDTMLAQIRKNPGVEYAEQNGVMHAFDTPNDPLFSSQYALQSDKLNMPQAWDVTTGVPSVVIAVCDTGITLTHPDLVNNLWTNPSPSGNAGLHGTRTEIDFNGDGDCSGSSTTDGAEQCAGPDPTDDDIHPTPEYHGTRVSGIIAATTNNALQIAGIARDCRLMGVKVLNSSGSGTFDSIADGIIFAADHGASVINMSLGGSSNSDTLTAAVNYAISKNVVVVAAAGNGSDNTCAVNYPAAIPPVIAVGATDENDALAFFSCTGPQVDLVAPGVNILSTVAPAGTDTDDGTSFASPMVAGVAALVRSLNPNMSVGDVTRYIDFEADDLGTPGFDNNFGFGRLNAFKTLTAVHGNTPINTNPLDNGSSFPYPNPYNPTTGTRLLISLPQSMGSQDLKITIRDLAGTKVKELSGTNAWDGRNDDGNFVASGMYFYYASTSAGHVKGKLTVLK